MLFRNRLNVTDEIVNVMHIMIVDIYIRYLHCDNVQQEHIVMSLLNHNPAP